MVETRNISLGGCLFHVELPAYEKLNRYLDELKQVLHGAEGEGEILEEVEYRLVELFQTTLGDARRAVNLQDVERACAQLGAPTDFSPEDAAGGASEGSSQRDGAPRSSHRRLFRDPDDSVFGGVCAGIAHRLGVDPVILRAVMLVLGLFSGVGIPLYLILWAIVPKARTAAERLAMRGDPVTVESIRSTVEKQMQQAREQVDKQNFGQRLRATWRRVMHRSLPRFLKGFGKFLLWLVIIATIVAFAAFGFFILAALITGQWSGVF